MHVLVQHLSKSQRGLILFSMVCRASRDAVLGNHQVWVDMIRRTEISHFGYFRFSRVGPAVVRDIPMAPYPNFKMVEGNPRNSSAYPPRSWMERRGEWPHMGTAESFVPFTPPEMEALSNFAKRRARINIADRCGYCGSRHKHAPVWGLGRRVCNACMKHNLVSSAALYFEYGFDYTRHVSLLAGRVYYFTTRDKKLIQYFLTHNPIDFRPEHRSNLAFFWRPHLEKLVDLHDLKVKLRAKAEAAKSLQAFVRAFSVRVTLMQRGRCFTVASSHQFFVEAQAKKKSEFYSVDPLPLQDVQLIRSQSTHWRCHCLVSQDQLRARAVLQRAFLAFRGRMTLPNVRNPACVIERLRQNEALREDTLSKWSAPFSHSQLFLSWRDMAPTLDT